MGRNCPTYFGNSTSTCLTACANYPQMPSGGSIPASHSIQCRKHWSNVTNDINSCRHANATSDVCVNPNPLIQGDTLTAYYSSGSYCNKDLTISTCCCINANVTIWHSASKFS